MAFVQLSDRVGVVPGGSNIGVVRGNDGVALIDTGLDENSARKALREVAEAGWGEVRAIVTTHGHADHFGGNAFVVKHTGARVLAPPIDEALIRYPILGPALLYGGADPLDTMRGKFLMGKASPVDGLIEPGELDLLGAPVTVISLAGHSPNQMGLIVDDVFFCADVVLPAATLTKYRVPYLFSLTDHLVALDRAANVSAATYVPGHGPHLNRAGFADLIEANRTVVKEVCRAVLAACREPRSAHDILAEVLRVSGADPSDAASYYLLQPTAAAVLTALHREGTVEHIVRDRQSLWRAVGTLTE